jgi:hypothetical protein
VEKPALRDCYGNNPKGNRFSLDKPRCDLLLEETILRLYGPLEPWLNKSWKPDDIELTR